jgi:hypothetical protein
MARDPQSGSFNSKVVDEQSKAEAKRAAAKGPTPDEALLANVQAQIAKLKALPDSKATAAADRAAAVTAARLASSPIAQEAARTTAALKKFTAAGGLLGVPGSNLPGFNPTAQENVIDVVDNGDGTKTITYSTGRKETVASGVTKSEDNVPGQTYTAPDGRIFTDLVAYNSYLQKTKDEDKRRAGQSAYDILFNEFDKYGMGSLVSEVKQYIVDGLSPAEFTLKLRASKPYQERFAANAKRIANGFKAIDEATYLGLEDSYQSIMQNYGLPATYYQKGTLGVQKGFEELIGGNVDPITLEERIVEGQKITKGNKSIIDTAKRFFPTLTDGDFLGYVLNPKNGLKDIKDKVTAVEIGAGAVEADLNIGLERALELGTAGINKAQAKQGFAAIGTGLQRGSQLAAIYGEDPYTQTTAETEVFGLAGKTKATREREKITGLEKATFGAKTGISSGALARDRAGAY